ncbi:tryptophan synthase subunit alpha [Kushneria phosphatilytica]|uniref:Tryptophan synthase alpha chain n=1 Tax=Kushneria phosphatilytica TaxID=657387 RepID=A0A1S1NYJ4_9GAMM|nr:tryptophan synthase subunit alpha [Kushneria phosphatilytica]OHV12935.1 tryptophan synthase subunit alpha [Kushneria phosphatilytica]QEL10801.1 tryptophan synthase subunit alpha [Kushneria phosphatilytica]
MNRIDQCFARLREESRKALIPYITAGDPAPQYTSDFLHALVDAGADLLEIGVPFSDPMADGPVIQKACERALKQGTRLTHVFEIVREFRREDARTPIVLMGYLNPIERMGYETFARECQAAGVDGVLIVDMPPEEADQLSEYLRAHQLHAVYLIAPTTSDERAAVIGRHGSGYLYYVSLKGVTGSATIDVEAVSRQLEHLRQFSDLPLCVGFGIRDAQSAAAVARVADGVIVGSALVRLIADNADTPEVIATKLANTLAGMREAMDRH